MLAGSTWSVWCRGAAARGSGSGRRTIAHAMARARARLRSAPRTYALDSRRPRTSDGEAAMKPWSATCLEGTICLLILPPGPARLPSIDRVGPSPEPVSLTPVHARTSPGSVAVTLSSAAAPRDVRDARACRRFEHLDRFPEPGRFLPAALNQTEHALGRQLRLGANNVATRPRASAAA
jgi:hypothetical protein